jgi:hypothetical protein
MFKSVAKGKRLEYLTRDILRQFGYKANRNPMSGALEWLKGDVSSTFPFFIECKNVEKSKFMEWYAKAKLESGPKPPMIIWTRNGEDVYCFTNFTDLLKIITESAIEPIQKIKKYKKQGIEETAQLQFSKKKQLDHTW